MSKRPPNDGDDPQDDPQRDDVQQYPPEREIGSPGSGRKHNVQLPPDEQRSSPDPKTGEGSHRHD